MIKSIDPSLRIGLGTFDGTDVVRFTIIVPGNDLCKVDGAAMLDDHFPTLCEKPVVSSIDEVLVVGVRTVMLDGDMTRSVIKFLKVYYKTTDGEKPRRYRGHIRTP